MLKRTALPEARVIPDRGDKGGHRGEFGEGLGLGLGPPFCVPPHSPQGTRGGLRPAGGASAHARPAPPPPPREGPGSGGR